MSLQAAVGSFLLSPQRAGPANQPVRRQLLRTLSKNPNSPTVNAPQTLRAPSIRVLCEWAGDSPASPPQPAFLELGFWTGSSTAGRYAHEILLASARPVDGLASDAFAQCRGRTLGPGDTPPACRRHRVLGWPARLLLLPQSLDGRSRRGPHREQLDGTPALMAGSLGCGNLR
jgi:hypothetical protein